MLNLFNKSKVRAGKQTNEGKKPAAAAGTNGQSKKPAPFAALGKTWAKLNKMDRKQAYTWGAVAVVALVALLTLCSVIGSDEEDFSSFETRGYDLANMPFSSDEAEQYLLASKYPDMQNTNASGLYTPEDKALRQSEDAEAAAEEAAAAEETAASSTASQYVPGRYYGGGSGSVTPTQVNTLNSANLKSASGSGVSGTFGPSGDFSNFRSQEKGQDVFNPQQGRGTGNARQALFHAAVGSRAAAGQRDNRLVNAKKAMMGGNIKGSDAFLSDSGAVDLSKATGLNLDTNAPVSGIGSDALEKGLKDAGDKAQKKEQQEAEDQIWKDMVVKLIQKLADVGLNMFQTWAGNQIEMSMAVNRQTNAQIDQEVGAQFSKSLNDTPSSNSKLGGTLNYDALETMSADELSTLNITRSGEQGKYSYTLNGQTVNSQSETKTLTLGADQMENLGKVNETRYSAFKDSWKVNNPEIVSGWKSTNKANYKGGNWDWGGHKPSLPDPKYMAEGAAYTIDGVTYTIKEGRWVNKQ